AACRALPDGLHSADLVTTEAVVTEASYLLDHSPGLQVTLQRLLAGGRPRVEAPSSRERLRIAELLEKYSDQPMDYADATLVVLAERLRTTRIFTLDRRDFSVYRIGRKRFEMIAPG